MKNTDNTRYLAHKRAVDAERKAQAILRAKAQTPAGIMARIAAAPKHPEVEPVPFEDVALSTTPVRINL
jgi:hypothetical protein